MAPAALVTGAVGGIGSAIVARLHAEGWRVALSDLDPERVAGAAAELEGAVGIAADVTDEGSVEALLANATAALGGLDLVVNNAGIELRASLAEHRPAAWDKVFAVNLDGPFLVTRTAVEALRTVRGSVVNIASIAVIGSGGQVAYDASKGALLGMTRSLAAELWQEGVRVNAICPGFIATPMLREAGLEGIAERVARHLPLQAVGQPEDVAAAVAFLASADAKWISGEAFFVDGGMVRG